MVHAIIINEIWHFCVLLLIRNKKRTFIGQNESTSLFLGPSGLFSVVSKSTPQMSIVSWICQLSVNIIQTLKQGHTTTPEAAFSTFCEKLNEWMCIYIPHISHTVSRRFTILIEWDRTSACKGASGCRYQSIFWSHSPTQPMHEMNNETTSSRIPYVPCQPVQRRCRKWGLQFIVLFRED